MLKLGDLSTKISKTNAIFEVNIFKIGGRQIFVKIKQLLPLAQSAQIWIIEIKISEKKCPI